MADRIPIILAIFVFIITAVLLFGFHFPEKTHFWVDAQNLGHIPLFGLVSIAILIILDRILRKYSLRRIYIYLGAFFLTVFAGAASELLQYFGPRDADFVDLWHDLIGTFIFLVFYATLDRNNNYFAGKSGLIRRRITQAAVIVLMVVIVTPLLRLGLAYLERDRAFPDISRFESEWEMKFTHSQEAGLKIVELPSGWKNDAEDHTARIDFLTGKYPGFCISEPYPDWSEYNDLSFSVYSEESDTIMLSVRIDDIHHDNRYEDRFTGRLRIFPGENSLRIPLEVIKKAPQGREMDMENIVHLLFFLVSPEKPYILYFDNIRLE